MTYTNVAERVPPAIHGLAEIVHDVPSSFERMSGAMRGMPLNREKYVRLLINGKTWMTDAEFERGTNREILREAHGDALIAGLGIGLILDPLIAKCSTVTVVERSQDVIEIVAKQFLQATIVHADILDWSPAAGQKFDTIYFDIWADVSRDYQSESNGLKRRFRKYLNPGGWLGSWMTYAIAAIPRSRR